MTIYYLLQTQFGRTSLPSRLDRGRISSFLRSKTYPYLRSGPCDRNRSTLAPNANHAFCTDRRIPSRSGVRFGLTVGIGGGIPNLKEGLDIRLGDIVVSQPDDIHGGVVQCDLGKNLDGGRFIRKGSLDKSPSLLLTAVPSLQSQRGIRVSQVPIYLSKINQNTLT
jgi:hypothetical protein